LVQAVTFHRDLGEVRDGLDRDVLDLVDGLLEWRERGASPVDPLELLDRLERVDPQSARWAVAVADSELREALRADGRNQDRVERTTVDASGRPLRMAMGRPTEEGDAYLRASLAAARRALRRSDEPDVRWTLAQSATIWAERMLERGRLEGVRESLAEAAEQLGLRAPATEAGTQELNELSQQLRAQLGDARPRLRPGR
jgi:hypothetical protein